MYPLQHPSTALVYCDLRNMALVTAFWIKCVAMAIDSHIAERPSLYVWDQRQGRSSLRV
jgi:hypothetical protein